MRQTFASLKQSRRNFSSQVAVYQPVTTSEPGQVVSLLDFSKQQMAEQAEKVASEADYLSKLQQFNTEKGVYKPMLIDESDNKHLNEIKKQVNSIVA